MHPVRLAALAEEPPQRGLVHRQRGRALQRVLGEPGAGEDLAHPGDVEVLTGVAGGSEREQFTVEFEAQGAHRCGLNRLVR